MSGLDVRAARVVLRERRLLDVLDLALRFLVAHVVPYAALSAIVLVPCGVATLVVAVQAGWGWAFLLALCLSSLAEVPFTILGSRLVFEPDVALESVLAASLRRVPRVAVVRLLEGVAVVIGATMLLLPALWIVTLFVFVTEIVALEGAGVTASMSRAQRMTTGRFGEAFMVVLAISGLHLVGAWLGDRALASILSDLLQITPPSRLGDPGGGVLALVSYWLLMPYVATARLFAYLDLRTRTEGWDVQVRFAAIARRTDQESA